MEEDRRENPGAAEIAAEAELYNLKEHAARAASTLHKQKPDIDDTPRKRRKQKDRVLEDRADPKTPFPEPVVNRESPDTGIYKGVPGLSLAWLLRIAYYKYEYYKWIGRVDVLKCIGKGQRGTIENGADCGIDAVWHAVRYLAEQDNPLVVWYDSKTGDPIIRKFNDGMKLPDAFGLTEEGRMFAQKLGNPTKLLPCIAPDGVRKYVPPQASNSSLTENVAYIIGPYEQYLPAAVSAEHTLLNVMALVKEVVHLRKENIELKQQLQLVLATIMSGGMPLAQAAAAEMMDAANAAAAAAAAAQATADGNSPSPSAPGVPIQNNSTGIATTATTTTATTTAASGVGSGADESQSQ